MATSTFNVPSRIVPTSKRLDQRDAPLAVGNVLKAADADLAAGKVGNAWAGYHEVLGRWLQAKWRHVSGKPNSPISDARVLVLKLRCSCYFDGWTYSVLLHIVDNSNANPTLQRVDILAGVVRALVMEGGAV